jgi:hypothetical protein
MRVGRSRREGPGTVQRTETKHSEKRTSKKKRAAHRSRAQRSAPSSSTPGLRSGASGASLRLARTTVTAPGSSALSRPGGRCCSRGHSRGRLRHVCCPGQTPRQRRLLKCPSYRSARFAGPRGPLHVSFSRARWQSPGGACCAHLRVCIAGHLVRLRQADGQRLVPAALLCRIHRRHRALAERAGSQACGVGQAGAQGGAGGSVEPRASLLESRKLQIWRSSKPPLSCCRGLPGSRGCKGSGRRRPTVEGVSRDRNHLPSCQRLGREPDVVHGGRQQPPAVTAAAATLATAAAATLATAAAATLAAAALSSVAAAAGHRRCCPSRTARAAWPRLCKAKVCDHCQVVRGVPLGGQVAADLLQPGHR